MPRPTPPPSAHRLRPDVDLYNKPVEVAATNVFTSSSSPRAYCNRTPNPEYITVNVPNVFAVADPCFITWLMSLMTENKYYYLLHHAYSTQYIYCWILTVYVVMCQFDWLMLLPECHCINQLYRPELHQSTHFTKKKNASQHQLIEHSLRTIVTHHHRRANLWESQFEATPLFGRSFGKYELRLGLLDESGVIIQIRRECCDIWCSQ